MSDDYFRKPKKARATNGDAWWYANAGGIQVYVQDRHTQHVSSVRLTRGQLLRFIEQTTPKPGKGKLSRKAGV